MQAAPLRYLVITSLLGAFLSIGTLAAQSVDRVAATEQIGGTLYYITLPDTVGNQQDPRFRSGALGDLEHYAVMIYSPVAQNLRLRMTGGTERIVAIDADEMIEFDLRDLGIPMVTEPNRPVSDVLRIESTSPVVLSVFMTNHFGTLAYSPLPVEAWGQEYYAASWPSEVVQDIETSTDFGDSAPKIPAPAQIIVIAAFDNTQVSIRQTGPLVDCNGCGSVVLDAGEAYMVQSFVDTNDQTENQPDIAGTSIQANKRIGVITGNTRAQLKDFNTPALVGNSAKDLIAEWIRPIELYGTIFAQTLFADELRPRGIDPERERSFEYLRIYPGDDATTATTFDARGNSRVLVDGEERDPTEHFDLLLRNDTGLTARSFATSRPAQAYFAPNSHSVSTDINSGLRVETWGSAMVELMPVEAWTSFAPFRTPSSSSSVTMHHYVNIVTDGASSGNIFYRTENGAMRSFPFLEGKIPGSSFVWGSILLDPGTAYLVEGIDGAVFSGYVYGVRSGYESIYTPSQNLAEYEELTAEAYAYPLPGSNFLPQPPDDYEVEVDSSCHRRCVKIRARNANPLGLRYLRLNADSTQNGRLEFIDPVDPLELKERRISEIEACLVPIDPSRPATIRLEWRGRSSLGDEESRTFTIQPVALAARDRSVALGVTDVGDEIDTVVTLVNLSRQPIDLQELSLADGTLGYSVVSTSPMIPWDDPTVSTPIAPGGTIRVALRYRAGVKELVVDTLRIVSPCGTSRVSLSGRTGLGCPSISDLDFGRMPVGVSRTIDLEICNLGEGALSFGDGSGADVLTWLDRSFDVAAIDIARLAATVLNGNDCITIPVTFSAGDTAGIHRTVARFRFDPARCRDTSIWRAEVVDSTSSVDRTDRRAGSLAITDLQLDRKGLLRVGLEMEHPLALAIGLYDLRGRRIAVIPVDRGAGAVRIERQVGQLPSGLYLLDIRQGNQRIAEQAIVVP